MRDLFICVDDPGEDDLDESEDASYRCCGSRMHVKRAAVLVSVSALVLCLFSAVSLALHVYAVNFLFDVVLLIVNFIAAVLILWAVQTEQPGYLLPFIITQIAQCAGFFMLSIYVIYATIVLKDRPKYQKFDQILMVISILIGLVVCGTAVYVTAKCYRYLREHRECNNLFVKNHRFWN